MLKVNAVLVMSLIPVHGPAFAADSPSTVARALARQQSLGAAPPSVLLPAAVREAARLAGLEGTAQTAPQAGPSGGSGGHGHPVLIGLAVGAGVGAITGALGECSVSEDDARAVGISDACGSRAAWAVLGAGVGAGVGALVGLLFR